jgi:uncharacterized protein YndB with AHSA1/START domain
MNSIDAEGAIIKEIVINSPAERIFAALTEPLERVKWWGLEGRFQAKEMESDLRVGGEWSMSGVGMGGKPFSIRGEYLAIERPCLVEFTWLANWEEGAPPSVVRFDLEEHDGATTVRLTHRRFASEKSRESYQGWPLLLASLQAHVENKRA